MMSPTSANRKLGRVTLPEDNNVEAHEEDDDDFSHSTSDAVSPAMLRQKSNAGFKALLNKWKVQDASVDQAEDCGSLISSIATKMTAKARQRALAQKAASDNQEELKLKATSRTFSMAVPNTPTLEPPRDSAQEKKILRKNSHNMNVYQKPLQVDDAFCPPKFPHSSLEKKLIRKALKRNFVFSDLTDRDLKPLVAAFEKIEFARGQIIIQQGDPGDYFYILQQGKVTFHVNSVKVGRTKLPGTCFGELALLYTCPRAASVVAARPTQLFRVDQKSFRFILQRQTTASEQEKQTLLSNVSFLKDLGAVDLKKLSEVMTPVMFETDQVLVKKGEMGDAFYLIQEGSVVVQDISVGDTTYEDQVLGPGEYFGERSLATSEPRAANVIALTNGICFSIDRPTFERVLGNMAAIILRAQDTRKLQGIKVIQDAALDASQMANLAQLIDDATFATNKYILRKGESTKASLYFVRQGKVYLKSDTVDMVVEQGGYFGHEMLAADSEDVVKAPYTAKVMTDCVCGILTLAECQSVFDLRNQGRTNNESGEDVHQDAPRERELAMSNTKLEDLERHKILGEGNFGQVWLVSDELPDKTRRPYALKIQAKYDLAMEGQVEHVVEERQTMTKMHHPFIIKLFQTYQDENCVYMLEELVQGGELFSLMHPDVDVHCLPEEQAKFYAIGIADALAYMHRGKYVFRDLKPENVMIDRFGFPTIIDFGFAKYVPEKTYTLCGTPGYLPPEVVMTRGHNCSADHWSLGILIYEMLTGENPFYYDGMSQMTLFESIVQDKYEPPPGASAAAVDIISKFLIKDPTQRLGSLGRGEREIFEQEWFRDIDLNALRRREIKAPWVPDIKDSLDTGCFDDWDHLEDKTKQDYGELSEKDAKLFEAF